MPNDGPPWGTRGTIRAVSRGRGRARAVVVVVTLVLAAGCTGGEEPGEELEVDDSAQGPPRDTVASALAAAYAGDHSAPEGREEAACFADALLERADVAALQRAGVVDEEGAVPDPLPVLDEATAGVWVDAQAACADFVEVSTRALTTQSKGRLDGEAYAACLRAELTPAQLREAQVQALAGEMAGPAVAALTQAQGTCAGRALPSD
ncbi:hypothetical protein GCM10023226_23530 [Nocardioides nanhaiensis]|uniref:DUF732 domain-containing protein n=1 Tax=Nocardioides nanhaiensis TaxID=1476871 RepID=A0ABP8WA99_9ACTN